jgi:hypothetical protein
MYVEDNLIAASAGTYVDMLNGGPQGTSPEYVRSVGAESLPEFQNYTFLRVVNVSARYAVVLFDEVGIANPDKPTQSTPIFRKVLVIDRTLKRISVLNMLVCDIIAPHVGRADGTLMFHALVPSSLLGTRTHKIIGVYNTVIQDLGAYHLEGKLLLADLYDRDRIYTIQKVLCIGRMNYRSGNVGGGVSTRKLEYLTGVDTVYSYSSDAEVAMHQRGRWEFHPMLRAKHAALIIPVLGLIEEIRLEVS